MKTIKLLIADDHRVLLDGLVLMLDGVPQIEVVATAMNGEEVLIKLSSYYIDVILMDIQMPVLDGYQTAKMVAKKFPETKIIILSMHSEKVFIEKMYSAGVSGYLLKSSGKDEIVKAIEKVAEGGQYFSAEVLDAILGNKSGGSSSFNSELTKREKQILALIAAGMSNPAIAEKLFVSTDTVKTHRKNIMRKLDLNNTAGLVKYALDNDITNISL